MTENESIEKLMAYQQDLIAEEECLQKLINKIDEQYRSLQVERMHICGLINKSNQTNNETTDNKSDISCKKEKVDPESQKLDLDVPLKHQSSEEEEEEEMDEDEME